MARFSRFANFLNIPRLSTGEFFTVALTLVWLHNSFWICFPDKWPLEFVCIILTIGVVVKMQEPIHLPHFLRVRLDAQHGEVLLDACTSSWATTFSQRSEFDVAAWAWMVWFPKNVDQRHAWNFDPPFSKVVQCAGNQALQVAPKYVLYTCVYIYRDVSS